MSESDLPVFLLGFFRDDELRPLRQELLAICDNNADDEEWQKFWSSSGAMAIPTTARESKELLKIIASHIKAF